METNSGGEPIRRALGVLCAFSLDNPELGVSEIARETGLPKSTVHRLLQILEEEGFVYKNCKNLKYRLSVRLFHLGAIAKKTMNLERASRQIIEKLRDMCQETVNIYVLDGFERVCIQNAEGPHLVRQMVTLGQQIPAYCGAAGKVLLAWQEDSFVEKMISITQLRPLTKNTISDPDAFKDELVKIRKQGYAVSYGERDSEVLAISAPIFDDNASLIAALGVSGPASRFKITDEAINLVKQAATEISSRLGYSCGL